MPLPDRRENTSIPADPADRRAEPRSPTDLPATIKLLNPLQASGRISARVIDYSRGGLKLRVEKSLMPGTLVQIRLGEKLLLGDVRFCSPADGDEFYAGVRLQDVFETGAGG
jgi:PilZ domain